MDESLRLPDGFVLDDYRIERLLGSGGFGITYLATDIHLDNQVAIKEFFPDHHALRLNDSRVVPRSEAVTADFEADLARFFTEAKTLAQLAGEPGSSVSGGSSRHWAPPISS